MNDFLLKTSVPVILCSNMLTFTHTNKSFTLYADLLKTLTKYNINVTHSNTQDHKLIYEFGKELKFHIIQKWRKSNRDVSLMKVLKTPAVLASGISTLFLPGNPNELRDRLKLLLQEKQAGNISDIIDEEIVAIADKCLECKCISKKQHKIFSVESLN